MVIERVVSCKAFSLTFKLSRRPDNKWTKPILIISFIAILIKFYEIAISNLLLENSNYIYMCLSSPIVLLIIFYVILYNDRDFSQTLKKEKIINIGVRNQNRLFLNKIPSMIEYTASSDKITE